jgi:hypothetical protein
MQGAYTHHTWTIRRTNLRCPIVYLLYFQTRRTTMQTLTAMPVQSSNQPQPISPAPKLKLSKETVRVLTSFTPSDLGATHTRNC